MPAHADEMVCASPNVIKKTLRDSFKEQPHIAMMTKDNHAIVVWVNPRTGEGTVVISFGPRMSCMFAAIKGGVSILPLVKGTGS